MIGCGEGGADMLNILCLCSFNCKQYAYGARTCGANSVSVGSVPAIGPASLLCIVFRRAALVT